MLYREYISSGRLGRGEVSPWLLQLIVMGYVFLPTAAGSFLGHGRQQGWRWVLWLTGASTEPRAWDYLWRRQGVTMIVRLKLESGAWLGGFFGNVPGSAGAYAAGYPEAQDLFLGLQVQVDPETGAFERDPEGRVQPVPSQSGLLVR